MPLHLLVLDARKFCDYLKVIRYGISGNHAFKKIKQKNSVYLQSINQIRCSYITFQQNHETTKMFYYFPNNTYNVRFISSFVDHFLYILTLINIRDYLVSYHKIYNK